MSFTNSAYYDAYRPRTPAEQAALDAQNAAAGNGPMTSAAHARGTAAFLAAKRKRRKKTGAYPSTIPVREDTPLRTHILSALHASLTQSKGRS